jgi:hypothetical protein
MFVTAGDIERLLFFCNYVSSSFQNHEQEEEADRNQ